MGLAVYFQVISACFKLKSVEPILQKLLPEFYKTNNYAGLKIYWCFVQMKWLIFQVVCQMGYLERQKMVLYCAFFGGLGIYKKIYFLFCTALFCTALFFV